MRHYPIFLTITSLSLNCAINGSGAQTNASQQRALEVLRKTIEGMDQRPAIPPKFVPRPQELSFAEVEERFLQGKMTAKELQRYLEEHPLDPAKIIESPSEAQKRNGPASTNRSEAASQNNQAAIQKTGDRQAESGSPPDQSGLSEVEKKMDELLRLKAARESQAATNSPPATNTAASAAPRNKRDRLNELLRLVIQGKITDAEYKERRGRLIAEPGE